MIGKIQKGEYCRAGKTLDVPPFFARVVGLSLSCSSLSAQENTSTSPAQTQTQALALHTCSTKIKILLVGTCLRLLFSFFLLRDTIFSNVSVDIPHPEFKSFSDHFWRQSIKSCGGFGRVSCVHCVSSVHNTHRFSPQLFCLGGAVVGSRVTPGLHCRPRESSKGERVCGCLREGGRRWIIQSTLPDKIQREPQLKEMARTRGRPLSLFLHHWIIERGGTFTFAKRKIYKSKYFAR